VSTLVAPFRMTPQRRAVLDAVRSCTEHPSVEQIHHLVQATTPGIGVATVYRTLDLLVEHGLVLQVRIGDESVARYDGNLGRHDHVQCESCGVIWDIDLPLPSEVLATARVATGVEVSRYDLQLTGRCEQCRTLERRKKPAPHHQ
jgi:Fe2+ or Zn2+ uptake regulation protein